MEVINILFSRLYHEKKEKENLLEKLINHPSISQYDDCIALLKDLTVINNSIHLLDSYLPKPLPNQNPEVKE